jgi:osmotically-inducible protein OsmY
MLNRKTNSQIQREVINELQWDTRVEPAQIGVAVEDGAVTLTGTVTALAKKLAAQEAAHRVSGVLDVVNEIHVMPPFDMSIDDQSIRRAVRQAMAWNAFVPQDRIRSTVSDGRVTLEGSVEALKDRDEAERTVQHLPGVRGVENRIIVSPPETIDAGKLRDSIAEALERGAHNEAPVGYRSRSLMET